MMESQNWNLGLYSAIFPLVLNVSIIVLTMVDVLLASVNVMLNGPEKIALAVFVLFFAVDMATTEVDNVIAKLDGKAANAMWSMMNVKYPIVVDMENVRLEFVSVREAGRARIVIKVSNNPFISLFSLQIL